MTSARACLSGLPFLFCAITLALGLTALGEAAATPADDAYLRGYVTAVLEQTLGIRAPALSVDNGVVRLSSGTMRESDRSQILTALRRIPGVTSVEIVDARSAGTLTAAVADPTAAGSAPSPRAEVTPDSGKPAEEIDTGFLPRGYLFDALLADPRWPHFSASYHRYLDDDRFGGMASVSFGETIPFYRGAVPFGGHWEVGIQAGVFAIFDMDSDSRDLVNADYFVGAAGAYAVGPFQALARLFHQSSHLGDEFLLHDRPERVNLSYEAVDLRLSYHFLERALRVYAGGGYLFNQDPASLDPWFASGGVEVRKRLFFLPGVTPVAAVNVQTRQETRWDPEISVRTGVQFDRAQILGRRLLLLLEYYHGNSPDGQFSRRKIDYLGIGAHFYFAGGGK